MLRKPPYVSYNIENLHIDSLAISFGSLDYFPYLYVGALAIIIITYKAST